MVGGRVTEQTPSRLGVVFNEHAQCSLGVECGVVRQGFAVFDADDAEQLCQFSKVGWHAHASENALA